MLKSKPIKSAKVTQELLFLLDAFRFLSATLASLRNSKQFFQGFSDNGDSDDDYADDGDVDDADTSNQSS